MTTFSQLLSFLLFLPFLLSAQENSVGFSERPESESTLAVHPQNSNLLVAAAVNDFSAQPGTAGSRLSIYYSSDGGLTWNISDYTGALENSTNINFIGDPVLSYGADGTVQLLHLVWEFLPTGFEATIILATSMDNGITWSPQNAVNTNTGVFDKPWLTTDTNENSLFYNYSYLTYVYSKDQDYRIEVVRRTADGTIAMPTIAVASDGFEVVQFPSIFTNRVGEIYLSFVGYTGFSSGLYICKSTDGGNSFSLPTLVINLRMYYNDFSVINPINRIGLSRLYPCPHLRIDNSTGSFQNRIYLTWTDKELAAFDYGLDVFLSYSDDAGQTWSAPRAVNNDGLSNHHQYYSTIDVSPLGEVILCWYDRREDSQNRATHYYFTRSVDGGQTFSEQFPLSNQASDFSKIGLRNSDFGIGEYTQVVASANEAVAVWSDGRENNGNINLYSAQISLELATSTVNQTALNTDFQIGNFQPNPAQVQTILAIELKRSLPIIFSIYSNDGKLIRQLPKHQYGIGSHQIELPVQYLPNGNYYISIKSDALTAVRLLNIAR